jgi:hypothetical protein
MNRSARKISIALAAILGIAGTLQVDGLIHSDAETSAAAVDPSAGAVSPRAAAVVADGDAASCLIQTQR